MDESELASAGYTIPRYRAPDDATWYHVLHGNVPNHQIDFMYGPEVPQGLLTPTHFSHFARLLKYIEPQTNASHAFAIGNLSRDDVQHEPGHGAVGLIFGMRIGGATDHAGRRSPPFAHGILTVDRDLTYATLLEASATFYRHVMYAGEAHSSTADFYREYVRAVVESPDDVLHVLARYVEELGDLPRLGRSGLSWDWVADEDAQPRRVVVVHHDDEPFGTIAHAAAKLGALLYRSNVRWTSITTGREADIPGGISVRFVADRDVTAEERRGALVRLEDLSEDEATLAKELFAAKPRADGSENRRYAGWRERYASQAALEGDAQAAAALPPPRRTYGSTPPEREGGREIELREIAPHGTEIIPVGAMRRELAQGRAEGAKGAGRERWTGRFDRPPGAEAFAAGAGTGAAPGTGTGAAPGTGTAAGANAWRDVGTAAPEESGGADDIEVTLDKPAAPSRTWLWFAIGFVCIAAVAAFLALPSGSPPPEPAERAPRAGARTAAPAPAPTAAPAPTPSAAAPAASSPGPAQPSGKPLPTAKSTSPPRKPPKHKCRALGDELCP